ncbi:MAG: sigma-70 family RNA polymerase sigma factor [Gemmataceae bacterium]|nr:sigma-70 family RNA polymerase sigma factor [Gemmataceae bacterium]
MAQGQLIKQFLDNRDAILGFAVALTRNYDVAEEIFQEVAMVVMEEDRKEAAVNNFLAWTREIVSRRVAEYYRKQTKREAVEQPTEAMMEVVTLAFAENEPALEQHRLRMQFLLECIDRLTGRSREAINGFYGQRKSLREIATGMNWEENSVKVALSRARKVLADCINSRLRMREAT